MAVQTGMPLQSLTPEGVPAKGELRFARRPAYIASVIGVHADRDARPLTPLHPAQSTGHQVCIVDPDERTSGSLASLLRSVKFDVEAFSTPRQLLDWQHSMAVTSPCCIISEIRLPEMSGLDLQRKLHTVWPAASVVLASEHADVATAVCAMKAGALSVLTKPVCEQGLIDLLNTHFRNSRVDRLSCYLEKSRRLLTSRQRDVFELLIRGLQTKEVAIELGLSPRTVDIYRAQIVARLEVGSVAEIIKRILGISLHETAPRRTGSTAVPPGVSRRTADAGD